MAVKDFGNAFDAIAILAKRPFDVHLILIGDGPAQELRGSLRVTVEDAASRIATSQVLMGFTLHEERAGEPRAKPPVTTTDANASIAVLVTGASGGIGGAIVEELAPITG